MHFNQNTVSVQLPCECPLCGTKLEKFLPFCANPNNPPRANAQCSECKSLERHRLVWLYFREKTNIFFETLRMLHIAPEPQLEKLLMQFDNLKYTTTDLYSKQVMIQMDVTDILFRDCTFDVIFASHVLEHIPDDKKAMSELYRVLKPGGWAILQVPIWGPKTIDNPSIISPEDRSRIYGQCDHVRLYGHDGEYERRLLEAGFTVKVENFSGYLGKTQITKFGLLLNEDIYFCTKESSRY